MQTLPPPGTAQPAGAGPPRPLTPAGSRWPLGRLVLSLALCAVGLVALVDLAGARVPVSGYLAVALTVVAAGLIVGARYGRARALIGVGAVLAVLLALTMAGEGRGWTRSDHWTTWQPASVQQLQTSYRIDAGNARLDLSGVDFTGSSGTTLDVHVSIGNLRIQLPPTVDVQIHSTVGVGNAIVLGQQWNGIGQGEHMITDTGSDGPGGGSLTITATVNVGNLEVRR
jgi:hypothetical protein